MKWERAAPRMRKLARAEAWYCSCLTAWTSWRRTEERSFSEKLLMQEMAKQRTWVSWYWEPSSSRAQKGSMVGHERMSWCVVSTDLRLAQVVDRSTLERDKGRVAMHQ